MYSEFSVIFKPSFVIRAVADQILPYVMPWLLEHIHCLIFQNTALVSAAGRASNLAQTDVSHSCISYVCSAAGLVFVQQLRNVNYVQQLQPFIYSFVEWYWLVNSDCISKSKNSPHSWFARRFYEVKKNDLCDGHVHPAHLSFCDPLSRLNRLSHFHEIRHRSLYERHSRQINFTWGTWVSFCPTLHTSWPISLQFDTHEFHLMPSIICELREYCCTEGYALLNDVNEILPALATFCVRGG